MKWVQEWPLLTIFKVPKRFKNSLAIHPALRKCLVCFILANWLIVIWLQNHNHHSTSYLCNLIQKDNFIKARLSRKLIGEEADWPDLTSDHQSIAFLFITHSSFVSYCSLVTYRDIYIGNISLFYRIWNGKWMFHSQPGNLSQSKMAFNLWLVSIHDDLLQAHHRVKTSILRAGTFVIQMGTVSKFWMTHIPLLFLPPPCRDVE